jgi:hypothetical protein
VNSTNIYVSNMKIENKLVVVGTFSVHKECNYELCAGQTSLTLIEFIANSNDIYVSNRKFGNKLVVVATLSTKECNHELCVGQTSLTLTKFIMNSMY